MHSWFGIGFEMRVLENRGQSEVHDVRALYIDDDDFAASRKEHNDNDIRG